MADKGLNTHVIYGIGTRTSSLMGCDRSSVLCLMLFDVVLVFANPSYDAIALAIFLFVVGLRFLRYLYKSDPFNFLVFKEHISYRPVYLARSTPFYENKIKYAKR